MMMRLFTSQGVLKLLALLSVGLTIAAIVVWRQTGEAQPLLARGAAGTFALALVVGLIDKETRPRVMLRFLSALFALIAVVAFASDVTSGGGSLFSFSPTSLLGHITELSPSLHAALRSAVIKTLGPTAWDPFALSFMSLPTFIIFGALALAMGFAGRPRDEVRVFVN